MLEGKKSLEAQLLDLPQLRRNLLHESFWVYENAPRMRERFAKLGLGCNPLSFSCVPHDVPDDVSKWCLRVYSWYQLKHHVAKLQEYKARRQTCKLGEPSLQRRFKTRSYTFILRVKLFGHWSDVQRVPVSQAEPNRDATKPDVQDLHRKVAYWSFFCTMQACGPTVIHLSGSSRRTAGGPKCHLCNTWLCASSLASHLCVS